MATTGFTVAGVDIGSGELSQAVPRSYLMDRYPELADILKQSGLWGWGANSNADLGDNTTSPKSSPVQTVAGGANWKSISTNRGCSGAVKTDGTLWLWGNNQYGQMGNNTSAPLNYTSTPVQTVSAGTNWKSVSASLTMAAIKTDGTLWMWGYNYYGQLGDNTTTPKSSPVQTVAGGTNWKQVCTGVSSTVAIKTDGTLWTWGQNDAGQLGDNTFTYRSSPIQTVAGGTNWKMCAISHLGKFIGAIKTDGTLWTWGQNFGGPLGDNTTTNKSSPIQTISAGNNWKFVAAGYYHMAAIKTDGTLWTWGYNNRGQLGNNTVVHKSSPVQTVAGGTNWKTVSCGYHTGAIKTDGTLWMWGYNHAGQLADGTIVSKSSPIQTTAGGTNWKEIACSGYSSTLSIRDTSEDQI